MKKLLLLLLICSVGCKNSRPLTDKEKKEFSYDSAIVEQHRVGDILPKFNGTDTIYYRVNPKTFQYERYFFKKDTIYIHDAIYIPLYDVHTYN